MIDLKFVVAIIVAGFCALFHTKLEQLWIEHVRRVTMVNLEMYKLMLADAGEKLIVLKELETRSKLKVFEWYTPSQYLESRAASIQTHASIVRAVTEYIQVDQHYFTKRAKSILKNFTRSLSGLNREIEEVIDASK